MRQTFTIGAFGIIFNNEEKVLLGHRRDYDMWDLPGGGVELGESPWDCVKREVKEESGLDVEIQSLSGVYSKPHKNDLVFTFICKEIGGELTLNDEADALEFFDVNNLPKNMSEKHIERIKDAASGGEDIHMKIQKGESYIDRLRRKEE
jgi:8-oxo-dGTP diphosphatase